MFDLVTGDATHIPARPALPVAMSLLLQLTLAGAIILPALMVAEVLPQQSTMMAFVGAPAPPPPPPPPPPVPAPAPARVEAPRPAPAATPIPVEAPPVLAPEAPAAAAEERPLVEGGVPGGVPGGVVAGIGIGEPVPPPPPPPAPERAAPVRVGGKIQPPAVIRRVDPVYPLLAAQAGIGGIVILEATVDAQGTVESVRVLRSANSLLDRAAVDAVRQWQYSPILLNGTPVRFVLTVTLSFNLNRDSE